MPDIELKLRAKKNRKAAEVDARCIHQLFFAHDRPQQDQVFLRKILRVRAMYPEK